MKRSIGIIITFLTVSSLIVSCEYKRHHEVPDGMVIDEGRKILTNDIYTLTEYNLGGKITDIDEWNSHLTCEGKSEVTASLGWTKISQLVKHDAEGFDYFIKFLDKYDVGINQAEYHISACRTEVKALGRKKKSFVYHVVYFLNEQQSVLYEIRNID